MTDEVTSSFLSGCRQGIIGSRQNLKSGQKDDCQCYPFSQVTFSQSCSAIQ